MALFRGLEVVEAMGQQLSGGGNAKERWRSIPFGQNAISNGTERNGLDGIRGTRNLERHLPPNYFRQSVMGLSSSRHNPDSLYFHPLWYKNWSWAKLVLM